MSRESEREKELPPPSRPERTEPFADLHIHSSFSDGTCKPAEIVSLAREAGLRAISLTDHDSVAGTEDARRACRDAGLFFLPGVELSISYGSSEIHILGYGVDTKDRSLLEMLDRLAAERLERMEKMILRLNAIGVPADFNEVRSMAGGNILSRLHLATHLLRRGWVSSRDDAFNRYIGNGGPAYVRRGRLGLKDALLLITGTGGIPVLAHPGLTRRDDLIDYLVRIGLRGIEVFYPRHSQGDVSRYKKICARYGLIATGGSDFHGEGKPDIAIGACRTPYGEFTRLAGPIGS